jgi:hypothetical protein
MIKSILFGMGFAVLAATMPDHHGPMCTSDEVPQVYDLDELDDVPAKWGLDAFGEPFQEV